MLTNDMYSYHWYYCCIWLRQGPTHLGVGLPGPVSLDEDAAQDALDCLEAGVPLTGQQGGQGVHVARCHQLLEPSINEPGQQAPSPACQTLKSTLCLWPDTTSSRNQAQ